MYVEIPIASLFVKLQNRHESFVISDILSFLNIHVSVPLFYGSTVELNYKEHCYEISIMDSYKNYLPCVLAV